MSDNDRRQLDQALAGIAPSRRGFLKNLMAAALAAGTLAAPMSEIVAADPPGPAPGKGKAKGKGKGKAKGKGKGKGKNPTSFGLPRSV